MTTLIPPTNITPFSTAPDIADLATFRPRALAWAQSASAFTSTTNAIASSVYNNAAYAYEQALAAAASASDAADYAASASGSASAAAASASTALNSPATSATSSTSLPIGNGTHTFTIQTGKAFVVGQTVVMSSAANALNQMVGIITAHNPATGVMDVTVANDTFNGSGAYADWVIALTASPYTTTTITTQAALLMADDVLIWSFILN